MAAFAQLFSLMVGAIVVPPRALRSAGAAVTFEPMENADHFLIFVEREKVLAKLERWLRSAR